MNNDKMVALFNPYENKLFEELKKIILIISIIMYILK